jgi:dimethylglycine dehydrogenase
MDEDLLRERAKGFDVAIRNRSEELAVIGLMGPKSRDVLKAVLGPVDIPWLAARETADSIRLLRVSYVGELGYELHVDKARALALFERLQQAGQQHGLGYYGAFAANSMRLEKGYRAWGMDLTTERTALESGLAPFVKAKERNFIGRDAMLARERPWRMVLLEVQSGDIDPFYSHTVYAGGRPIGIVTSGALGHRTGKTLALAYLREQPQHRSLVVNILGTDYPAVILDAPPYDPANRRMKD